MILYIAILIFSVFISAFSQVLLKKSALKTYNSFLQEYLNIPVGIIISCWGGSTI